jgi:hypothetical protein
MCWVPLSARVDTYVLCPLRKRSFGEDDEEETESALLAARRPLAANYEDAKRRANGCNPLCAFSHSVIRTLALKSVPAGTRKW